MELLSVKLSYTLWLLLLPILRLSLSFSLPAGNDTDRLSLLAFKAEITNDPLEILSYWNDSLHFCNWSGVTCGRRHQRVVQLDLHTSKLQGRLTPHIGNLSFLRILNLENNRFSNDIPHELGRLSRLETLSLADNKFTGEIPVNLSRCSNLLELDFVGNYLTGQLPSGLGLLSKLEVFSFGKNNLVGQIPPSFGNLSALQKLSGALNSLQGEIPSSLGKLRMLSYLALGGNNLSGAIPPSIFNLSSLTVFSFPLNQIQGKLPLDIGQKFPNLNILRIYGNQLSGPIPETISNMSSLLVLSLANNNFTGKVPPTLGKPPNLEQLGIDSNSLGNNAEDDLDFLYPLANNTSLVSLTMPDNNLGGVMPEILSNFSKTLVNLGFGRNKVRGSIPTEIGNLVNLQAWGFEENQLTGIIPSSVGKLGKLSDLFLDWNHITGNIPSSVGNMTSLGRVNLRQNNLQGSIPASIGNCQRMLSLALSQNNLSGPIPKELFSVSSLALYLVLSDNQLTGSIPSEVGELVNLGYLDLSGNELSGEIPATLGSCIRLEELYFNRNLLQGTIPDSLSSLRGIQYLDLSYNNLTGQIPTYLEQFSSLETLNLSFNNFQGEVPVQGVFLNASAISVMGNRDLCGGIPELDLPKCNSEQSRKPKLSKEAKLIIADVCGFLGLVLMISLLLLYVVRRKSRPASLIPFDISLRQLGYHDLLRATDGFSSANLLGVGSFGTVYKGTLQPDETTVAVKVFKLPRKEASKSFMAECEALANIRHRNLVTVVTACSSVDFQGNDFKAIIYKFMENGSLEDWLHPVPGFDHSQRQQRKLSLIQRLNIAVDVASAVDYLHNHCQTPIIHCDLKPSNVLLDGDLTAHVGDFGLARFLREASHQLQSNNSSSIGIKGTVGYAAPEYGMRSEVSSQGDVYSYGILLLEMFTGKRPTDVMFKDGLDLHNFAQRALPDHIHEVMDLVLVTELEETSADASEMANRVISQTIQDCMVQIFKIGVNCCAGLPKERVDISEVVPELQHIRDTFIRNGRHEIVVVPEG